MNCDQCDRLERLLLEARVFEDRAHTAMRCYLTTHRNFSGVSDMDEYLSLRAEEQKTTGQRHDAFMALARHQKEPHVEPALVS